MTATWKDPTVPMILAQFYASDRLTGVAGQVAPTATLWVNGVFGNDNATKAQVAAGGGAITWETIGRAVWGNADRNLQDSGEAAAAGDVVSIAAGDYTTNASVDETQEPVYNPVNEGSATAFITFQANGIVRMGSPAGNAPLVGTNARDYIRWYADVSLGHEFQLVCDGRGGSTPDVKADPMVVNTRPDTGPVHFAGSSGCRVEGFRIDAGPLIDYTDNWIGIRFEGCTGGYAANNTVFGFHNASDTGNGNGLKIYYSRDVVMEHNYVYDCGGSISIKDVPASTVTLRDNIVRFNRFEDSTNGAIGYSIADENGNQVYQNLIIDAAIGVFTTGSGGNLINEWIYNNTFVNCTDLLYVSTSGAWSGVLLWNNIHYNGTNRVLEFDGQTMKPAAQLSCQHNVYHFSAGNFYGGSDGSLAFIPYKGIYTDQDVDDPDSLNTDPLFTNPGAGDYTLQVGSPARNLGRHPLTGATMHAGCYQTGTEVIGVVS
jgi:hypothetical protein